MSDQPMDLQTAVEGGTPAPATTDGTGTATEGTSGTTDASLGTDTAPEVVEAAGEATEPQPVVFMFGGGLRMVLALDTLPTESDLWITGRDPQGTLHHINLQQVVVWGVVAE